MKKKILVIGGGASGMAAAAFSANAGTEVTLIEKNGSAPRSTGARMIVKQDGTIISSIGGGFGEYEAAQYAKENIVK